MLLVPLKILPSIEKILIKEIEYNSILFFPSKLANAHATVCNGGENRRYLLKIIDINIHQAEQEFPLIAGPQV